MSNLFNVTRFFALIRRQWIGFGRIYLMSIGVMAGLICFFYIFNIWENYGAIVNDSADVYFILNFRPPLFCILGLFFVTVVSSTYFADLGRKTRAIFELMIPASQLEKFLTGIFYTVIVSISSYLLLYYVIDMAFVSYLREFGPEVRTTTDKDGAQVAVAFWRYFFDMDYPEVIYYLCFLPLLLNAVFLMGGIIFKNYQYIKTAISLFLYGVVWLSLFVYFIRTQMDNTVRRVDHSYWSDSDHIFAVVSVAGIVLSFLFWGIAYLRLKEKEI